MVDIETIIKAYKFCKNNEGTCEDCPYFPKRSKLYGCPINNDMISAISEQKAEIDRLKAEKRKEEIKVGDEVASVNPATGELNLWNTFIVTEIGEDFIGGINSKGETHFHDEPGIFNIWAKTGKHIDILRAFEPAETASPKAGDQE